MSKRTLPLTVGGLLLVVVVGGMLYGKLRKPTDPFVAGFPSQKYSDFRDALDIAGLERLAVLRDGRFQPADTTARSWNRVLTDSRYHGPEHLLYRQDLPDGRVIKEPAALTMFGIALAPRHYFDAPMFSIVSDPVRRSLFGHHWQSLPADDVAEVEKRKGAWLDANRSFTYREILIELATAYDRHTDALAKGEDGPARAEPRRERVKRLREQVAGLANLNSVERRSLHGQLIADFREGLVSGALLAESARKHLDYIQKHVEEIEQKFALFDQLPGTLRIVPTSTDPFRDWMAPDGLTIVLSASGGRPGGMDKVAPEATDLPDKFVLPEALEELDEAGLRSLMGKWKGLRQAFVDLDAEEANALIAEIGQIVRNEHASIKLGAGGRPLHYPTAGQMGLEVFYNGMHKFVWSWYFFAIAAVVLLMAVSFRDNILLAGGLGFFGLGFLAMVAGFVFRLLLAQRGSAFSIPIANQYESLLWAMFFGTVIGTGVVLWSRSWNSVGALVGVSILGVVVMGVSYFKPMGVASELEPEVPVLRAALLPFHVGSMVGGYAIIALAFGVALVYLIMWFWSGSGAEDKIELAQADLFQARIVKGVFFLLLVGLILGAAWGDVAWGRWWGWDPKETWAFVTWLVYAIVIHARLILKDRGVATAVMSAWGFGIMLFTWWGTNYKLTTVHGLHAYSGIAADEASNVVPLIWAGMTLLFPITGSFLPGGLAIGAYSVAAARKRADSPVPRLVMSAALCVTLFTAAVFVGLYLRYGATPLAMWEWVNRTSRTAIDATHVLTNLDVESASQHVNWLLLGVWTLIHLSLSLLWGWLFTAVARKDPAN